MRPDLPANFPERYPPPPGAPRNPETDIKHNMTP